MFLSFAPSRAAAADCTVKQAWERYTVERQGCEMFNPDAPLAGSNYPEVWDSALCV